MNNKLINVIGLAIIGNILIFPLQASIPNYPTFKCPYGHAQYNKNGPRCYYCPQGTERVESEADCKPGESCNEAPLICAGTPKLGNRCPYAQDHYYDSKQKLCTYCPPGYDFSFNRTQCFKK